MANSLTAQIQDGVPAVWYPVDHGLISWSYDPSLISGTYKFGTAGTVYTVALKVNTGTITNVGYVITTAGATLTASQNFVAVYQNGTLLGTSVAAATITQWGTTGYVSTPLSAPVNVQSGVIVVAFVYNGTTAPTLASGSTQGNVGIAASSSRFGTANTSITTALPSTLGTISALAQTPWVAVS